MKGVDFISRYFVTHRRTTERFFMKTKIIIGLFAMTVGISVPSVKANAYPIAGATRQIQQIMTDYHKRLNQNYEIGYTNTTVNLREKETVNSDKIKTLPLNTQVEYVDDDSEWADVIYDGGTIGYIKSQFLSKKKIKVNKDKRPKEHLTKQGGVFFYNGKRESYYNLDMSGVVNIMHQLGFKGEYSIRSDGAKLFDGKVMIAADLSVYPRGTILYTSLGKSIVCDTGEFVHQYGSSAFDIATNW